MSPFHIYLPRYVCLAKFSRGQTIILELQRPFDLTGQSRQTCYLGLPWGIVRLLPPGSRAGSSRNWVGFLISAPSRRGFWIISVFLKIPTKYLQHPVYFSEWNYQKRVISYTCSPVAGWFVANWDKIFLKRQVLRHSASCLMESRVYSCARVLKKKFQPWFFQGRKLTIFSYWSPSFPESHKLQTILHSKILKFFPFLPVIKKVVCSVQWPW